MADEKPFLVTIVNQRTSPCLVYVQPAGESTQLPPGGGTLIRVDKAEGAMVIDIHEYGGIDIRAVTGATVASARDLDNRRRFLLRLITAGVAALLACLFFAWLAVGAMHGWFGKSS
jgi:hypothetical protein